MSEKATSHFRQTNLTSCQEQSIAFSDIVRSPAERDSGQVAPAEESQIYRDLMRFKPEGLSPNAWAVEAGVSRTVWTDMRRHGNPSRRTLEKLLAAASSSIAEFEALRVGPDSGHALAKQQLVQFGDVRRTWSPAPLPPLPLVASSLAGQWGEDGNEAELVEIQRSEIVDRLPRPESLASDTDAFALTVLGGSMWPRFRPGTRVGVSPRSPVAVGDDVLVTLKKSPGDTGPEKVLVLHLVRRTMTHFELRQFQPDRVIRIAAGDIDAVMKIPGELI